MAGEAAAGHRARRALGAGARTGLRLHRLVQPLRRPAVPGGRGAGHPGAPAGRAPAARGRWTGRERPA